MVTYTINTVPVADNSKRLTNLPICNCLPYVNEQQHYKERREGCSGTEAGIVVPQSIACPRRNVAVVVWDDCLVADGDCDRDRLGCLCKGIICLARDDVEVRRGVILDAGV